MSDTIARLTLDQYDRMIAAGIFDETSHRRIELFHGELREMAPIGNEHELAVDFLTEWSLQQLPKGVVWVRVQNSVGLIELESTPQPDLAWVARKRYSSRPTGEDVALIIEVAMSSLRYERGEKAGLYAMAGIRDYWIVNLVDNRIEVHRDPVDGNYQIQIYESGDSLRPLAFPEIELNVGELLAHVWPQS